MFAKFSDTNDLIPFFDYKCHVCLGSYNETAEHAKRQRKGAEESSRAARQGRGAGRGPGQGNRARQQGSGAEEQGMVAEQGSRAGQQARGEHLSTNMLTFCRVYEHW